LLIDGQPLINYNYKLNHLIKKRIFISKVSICQYNPDQTSEKNITEENLQKYTKYLYIKLALGLMISWQNHMKNICMRNILILSSQDNI